MTTAVLPLTENRLDRVFTQLKKNNIGALVAFVAAGDPFATVEGTADVITTLAASGADVIEIGIPYSDPLADGKSIQAASQRALDRGVTPDFVLDVVKAVRLTSDVPLVLMTYYNPVLIYGHVRFAEAMRTAGADGIIITDLPPEEADGWKTAADLAGIATIFLLAPTSTAARITAVTQQMKSGFVYCVSRTGVTGTRQEVPEELAGLISSIRQKTTLPLCVGFGISTPEHVKTVTAFTDGAVIGSALVEFLTANANNELWREKVGTLVGGWKAAAKRTESS
jgi:tryptophan synthase alpha chain